MAGRPHGEGGLGGVKARFQSLIATSPRPSPREPWAIPPSSANEPAPPRARPASPSAGFKSGPGPSKARPANPSAGFKSGPGPSKARPASPSAGFSNDSSPLDHGRSRLGPGPQGRDLGDRGRHYSSGRRPDIKFDLPPKAGRLRARRARSGSLVWFAALIDRSATGMTRGAREPSRRRGRPRPGSVRGNRRAHREAHQVRPFGDYLGREYQNEIHACEIIFLSTKRLMQMRKTLLCHF
jgi:hypothetical protein